MTLANISLAQIMDSMAEGLFVLDAEHRIVLWNRAMEILTGYSAMEAMGKDCDLLDCAVPQCPLSEGQDIEQVECQLRHKDGSRVPALKNGRVLKDNAGNTIGMVETVTDLRPIRQLQAEVSEARSQGRLQGLGKLKGKSHAMRTVYERIGLAAQSEATILVVGETGTGKELAAQAIHTESARHTGPLIKVNCSALSEGLLESELFGHVKGAFTGAIQDKVGRFEAAHKGTIFLDEIGDISPLIQLKLLRVLQERSLEPVGSSDTRKVDVRVIAATHRDLKDLVRRGQFREDLFYRLHVFQIEMPPLRTRKEDIPLLIQSFRVQFNQDTGKRIESLSDEVLYCLMDYCWPGNVRELENAIEHAYVTCSGPQIGLFDLPVALRQTELRRAECDRSPLATPPAPSISQPSMLTKDALIRTLEQCQGNKAEAARKLGINRATVWRKMKLWDISMQQ
jgi:two-component system response regulator HydG